MVTTKIKTLSFLEHTCPVIASTSVRVLEMLENDDSLRVKLRRNAEYFRDKMTKAGFKLLEGDHAIIPVMLGDAKLASDMGHAHEQGDLRGSVFPTLWYPWVRQELELKCLLLTASRTLTMQSRHSVKLVVNLT